jgi:hypothetical protein
MVKTTLLLIIAITAGLTACCDDYVFLRANAQLSLECDVKDITDGDDGPRLIKGAVGHIERRADTLKGTAIRFEVTCGTDIKHYTLKPICADFCDSCRGDKFEGEISDVNITSRGFYLNESACVLGPNRFASIHDAGGYLTPD